MSLFLFECCAKKIYYCTLGRPRKKSKFDFHTGWSKILKLIGKKNFENFFRIFGKSLEADQTTWSFFFACRSIYVLSPEILTNDGADAHSDDFLKKFFSWQNWSIYSCMRKKNFKSFGLPLSFFQKFWKNSQNSFSP